MENAHVMDMPVDANIIALPLAIAAYVSAIHVETSVIDAAILTSKNHGEHLQ